MSCARFCWTSLTIKDRGVQVVLVNPYHVKQSKELDDNSQMKSDRKDAW